MVWLFLQKFQLHATTKVVLSEIQIKNFRFINIIFSILYLIWNPNISKSSESLEEVEEVFSSKFFISGHCAEISALEQK